MDAKASGQPLLPDPATLREVVNNEDIIHRDDMVDFWFLSAGARARGIRWRSCWYPGTRAVLLP